MEVQQVIKRLEFYKEITSKLQLQQLLEFGTKYPYIDVHINADGVDPKTGEKTMGSINFNDLEGTSVHKKIDVLLDTIEYNNLSSEVKFYFGEDYCVGPFQIKTPFA